MIESMSLKIAKRIKEINPDETPSVNVMRYSIKFLLLNMVTVLLVVISGILLKDLTAVLISFCGFAALRFVSGGYHISNAWMCAIVSCSVLHINALSANDIMSNQIVLLVTQLTTLVLMGVYAPSNIEKQTKFKKENYKWLKLSAILMCLINILIINNDLLTSVFFLQGLTLIHFKREGVNG